MHPCLQSKKPWQVAKPCQAARGLDQCTTAAQHSLHKSSRINRASGRRGSMRLLGWIAGALMALTTAPSLAAWPDKPITAIVPFAAGGGTDGVARILADQLGRNLGQAVVIENRGGANGNIGAVAAARARPDGYSFFFTTGTTQAINPALYRSLPYDPLRDFTPVGRIGVFPLMLAVHPGVKAENIGAFITALKAEPGKYTFGHWSAVYLAAGKNFVRQIGAEVLDVPYRSSANTMTDLVAGRISFAIVDLTIGIPLARGNEVRPLAVTGAQRSALLPNLPTLQEAGLAGYDIAAWMGVYAPANTPAEALRGMEAALARVLADPAVVKRLSTLGFEPMPGDAAELARFNAAEITRWQALITAADIKVE
ncbi:MAG: tripartite tricarboxylate transporter substrate binding protein [Acetobacteraceae bacterium]|nr:tripartite tricarboxylate transporter substrate binding protein [Acetobacteraceae bacterium]